jgi:hypothetical protein
LSPSNKTFPVDFSEWGQESQLQSLIGDCRGVCCFQWQLLSPSLSPVPSSFDSSSSFPFLQPVLGLAYGTHSPCL